MEMTLDDIIHELAITVIKKENKPEGEDPADWAVVVYFDVKRELDNTPVSPKAFEIATLVVEKQEIDLGDQPGAEAARIYKTIEGSLP